MSTACGYAHPHYATSLAEWGTPRRLPASGAWALERAVPGAEAADAMGCYPLLMADHWERLREDLDGLAGELVSFTAVCDPFGAPCAPDLSRLFDLVRPFKTHVVVDLHAIDPSRHHLKYARSALRRVRVEEVDRPLSFLDEWCGLYQVLVERHALTGLHAFSRQAFGLQLSVPGVRVFRAVEDGRTVAAHVWYVVNRIAYWHLQAASERGYALKASYALFAEVLERLGGVADCTDLGGSAGGGADDGLLRFKAGWSPARIPVYLCGSVLQPQVYQRLCGNRCAAYFPAYRDGELTQPAVRGRA